MASMKYSYPSFVIAAAALLTCSLLVGCSSKKKTDTVSETATESPAKPSYSEQADTVLIA